MKAVYIEEFGDNDVVKIGDLPIPELQPNQVLIRIAAAGVNPVDWKIRQGYLAGGFPHQFPLILGWDMAGTIDSVGSSVQGFSRGDEVYCYNRMQTVQFGTYAEYGLADASALARTPQNLDLSTASTIPLTSLTAWQGLLDIAGLQTGETLLVLNGSGGVGGIAIQLARHMGANVMATASSTNHPYLESLGADVAIDYNAGDIKDRVLEIEKEGVDVVFDCTGAEEVANLFTFVKSQTGRIVTINGLQQSVPVLDKNAAKYNVRANMFHVTADGAALEKITDLVEREVIRPLPVETFPLDDAKKALSKSQAGHVRGKLSLVI